MATSGIGLPARYGCQEIVSDVIWLLVRYSYLQDVTYNQILIANDLTYPAISSNI